MKHFVKYLAFLIVFAAACDDSPFVPTDLGIDYFPLRKGLYFVYDIDSTGYSFNDPVTRQYQIKILVADSFANQDYGYTYVLKRSIRANESSEWRDLDTWSARFNDEELIVNEQSKSYLKLTFPTRKGSAWNGNLYNNDGVDSYAITQFDEPQQIGGFSFEKTLTVEQELNDDLVVLHDLRHEVYARGVGLVRREITRLVYCTLIHCLNQQQVQSGMIYKQQIVEYGKQ